MLCMRRADLYYFGNHDWELDVLSALTYAMCTLIDFAYLLMYFPQ